MKKRKLIKKNQSTFYYDFSNDKKGIDNGYEQNFTQGLESERSLNNGEEIATHDENSKEIKNMKKNMGKNFEWKKMTIIGGNFILTILVTILRGGKGLDSIIGVSKCEILDWLILIAYITCVMILNILGVWIVLSEQKIKDNINWPTSKWEVTWRPKNILITSIASFFIGLVAAISGIGGGMLITPFMLTIGFLPTECSYTAMYIILVSKIVSSFAYFISGLMPVTYALCIGFLLVIMVLLTEILIGKIIKKYGRQSIISGFFAIFSVISLFLVLYAGISKAKKDSDDGKKIFEFYSYCD